MCLETENHCLETTPARTTTTENHHSSYFAVDRKKRYVFFFLLGAERGDDGEVSERTTSEGIFGVFSAINRENMKGL